LHNIPKYNDYMNYDAMVPPTAKVELFPVEKNTILFRISNIGDNFDNGFEITNSTFYFKIKDYAKALF